MHLDPQVAGLVSALIFVVCALAGTTGYFWAKTRQLEKQLAKTVVDVQYFETVEDSSGILKNSRKMIVKSQVFLDGVPVGGPQIVSEHLIEEFSYEKLKTLRAEVLSPLVKAALELKSLGAAKAIGAVIKQIK